MVSDKTIARLSLYRRLLKVLEGEGVRSVFSQQLATMAGGTAAQLRRDLMEVGYSGTPNNGYEVARLADSIRDFLDVPGGQSVVLVGVGNLGKALLSYFATRRSSLQVVAAFDSDPYKVNRVIHGCRCYPMDSLSEVLKGQTATVAVIAVPAAGAQGVAEALTRAGVRGILNFAPVRLRVSPNVYVEDIDMTVALEKVAYFGRPIAGRTRKEPPA
ncbi:MAG: redox-sensing transcriptional repressor Rex [Planctomycetota bacterium]|nr:redox-sensing transcriptional repressor Rex [Planctomycetota bacterium]